MSLQKIGFILALLAWPVFGVEGQKAVGLSTTFYTGEESQYFSPAASVGFSFSAMTPLVRAKWLGFVHRFGLDFAFGGKNFANSLGGYFGIIGTYSPMLRFNMGKEGLVPYVEVGPSLGMFIARLTSTPTSTSQNQTAFKYGYSLGLGFDFLGKSGISVGLDYFQFLTSPSIFEFAGGSMGAKGILVEVRYSFGPSGDQ